MSLAYVSNKTSLRLPADLSSVRVYNDPSLIHPYWFFIRLRIPPQTVNDFVALNHLKSTNETTLRRQRESIPEAEQRIDGPTARFYKQGRTNEGLPFEVLVDEGGDLILFAESPD